MVCLQVHQPCLSCLFIHPGIFISYIVVFISKSVCLFISLLLSACQLLNIWNTFIILFNVLVSRLSTPVPVLGWFQLVAIPVVLVFFALVCLIIFNWVPDSSDFTLLGVVFWIPRTILKELCFLMQLIYLRTVCDLSVILLLRFARWVTSSVQAPTGHLPQLRRRPSCVLNAEPHDVWFSSLTGGSRHCKWLCELPSTVSNTFFGWLFPTVDVDPYFT